MSYYLSTIDSELWPRVVYAQTQTCPHGFFYNYEKIPQQRWCQNTVLPWLQGITRAVTSYFGGPWHRGTPGPSLLFKQFGSERPQKTDFDSNIIVYFGHWFREVLSHSQTFHFCHVTSTNQSLLGAPLSAGGLVQLPSLLAWSWQACLAWNTHIEALINEEWLGPFTTPQLLSFLFFYFYFFSPICWADSRLWTEGKQIWIED